MQPERLPRLFLVLAVAVMTHVNSHAANLPADHPCVAIVKDYLTDVVNQDWKGAAGYLAEFSLVQRQRDTVAAIKMAPTMTEEAAMLAKLGVKDVRELEKMTPQDLYVAERQAVHEKLALPEDVVKRKKESLKVDVLGVCGEEEGKIVHIVVRTSQETMTDRIEELFLISLVQDKDNAKKWFIVPEMMRPTKVPLADAAADSAPAPAPAK
ncbi:MAG: hypothetical protein KDK97_05625 [Verrucomicrobiales bacterium]|nr:hypothetical protein [Verrucomicrobiales bacterium]MCP5559146.1 hypothetical protein [Verrucomicrobiaceae bacterium]